MDDPNAVDRRAFLKTGAIAAAARAVACGTPESGWRALSEDEARISAPPATASSRLTRIRARSRRG